MQVIAYIDNGTPAARPVRKATGLRGRSPGRRRTHFGSSSSASHIPETLVMKGLWRIALAVLFVAACGGDNGIAGLDGSVTPNAPSSGGGILAIGVDSTTGASIETNKDDYSPGEVVHLVGRGWAAGETVNLRMTEVPNTHADIDTNVVADLNGGFDLHFYDVQLHDLGVTFTLTATGQTSHSVAVATFTDGSVSLSSTSPVAGVLSFAVTTGDGTTSSCAVSPTFTVANSITFNTGNTPSCAEVRAPTTVVVAGTPYSFTGWSATLTQSQGGTINQVTGTISSGTIQFLKFNTNHQSASGSVVAEYGSPNAPPTAEANGDYSGPTNTPIALSGVGSTDTDGTIATYAWTYSVVSAPGGSCSIANASTNSPTGATISCTQNGTYEVKLTVTDDDGATDDDVASLTITNTAPTANPGGPYSSTAEGSSLTLHGSGNDTDGTIAGYLWSWQAVTADAGAACTIVNPTLATASISCTDDGTFQVTLTVTDDDGQTGEATVNITVTNATPVVEASGGSGNEGSAINISASFTDAGANDSHPTRVWSYTANAGAEGTCTLGSSSASPTTITCTDDGSYTIKYSVTDDDGSTGEGTATVTVTNDAPVITTINAPIGPVPAGNVTVSWAFTDPGADDWTCSIEWDVAAGFTSASYVEPQSCSATRSLTPGLYTVTIKVADDDGGEDVEQLQSYIVVYDPNGGFVTGGGWINSVAGNYRLDPSAEGKANFGFVSKYQPGKNVPTGNTEFQFHAGDLNFKSTSYEWLVVAGTRAMYKGEGTIAGRPGVYLFLLSAIDGSPDKFRIKIWEKSTAGTIVYDTLPVGAEDDAEPTTTLGGGSIVVHTRK
jgi:hypothetical protein